MKKHHQFFLFLVFISILPKESLATLYQCVEPARTSCISHCSHSSCRAQCEQSYCGPSQPDSNANPVSPGVGSVPATNYGIPLYYGPFFPQYSPDQLYLQSLLQDLNRQRDEIVQFKQLIEQFGDPILQGMADSALRDVQSRISIVQYFATPYPMYYAY